MNSLWDIRIFLGLVPKESDGSIELQNKVNFYLRWAGGGRELKDEKGVYDLGKERRVVMLGTVSYVSYGKLCWT